MVLLLCFNQNFASFITFIETFELRVFITGRQISSEGYSGFIKFQWNHEGK